MDKINQMLEEELIQSLNDLSSDEYGSEERAKRINEIALLNKTLNETKDEKSKKRFEVFKVVLPVVGSICTFILYAALFKEGLAFEQDGTVTSATVRSLFQGLLRPKV